MKDDVIYNKHDNKVMVKTDGDLIYIICHKQEQQDNVVKRMTTDNKYLSLMKNGMKVKIENGY